ncbi:hypothetical protein Fmac_027392 [Flemingia macrophylla]|uniref:Uncharacterized protein n=1 Tax=Flemingia macrophylla TaxID=520843 RepID=A0ABD1LI49_9FABA
MSLVVLPNSRPLFSSIPFLSHLSCNNVYAYFKLLYARQFRIWFYKNDALNVVFPKRLLCVVDPPMWSSNAKGIKVRKQVLLNGPVVGCKKRIALAILVQWAREKRLKLKEKKRYFGMRILEEILLESEKLGKRGRVQNEGIPRKLEKPSHGRLKLASGALAPTCDAPVNHLKMRSRTRDMAKIVRVYHTDLRVGAIAPGFCRPSAMS